MRSIIPVAFTVLRLLTLAQASAEEKQKEEEKPILMAPSCGSGQAKCCSGDQQLAGELITNCITYAPDSGVCQVESNIYCCNTCLSVVHHEPYSSKFAFWMEIHVAPKLYLETPKDRFL
ncbi:hypothetical protein DM02DRAFT_626820 [Periconia macrospinosa]|uniref:Uncharacterized protein n=1 Tax=Periconia macrospinosa TaxID=97972 RepID=A0A2V1DVW6_9PLEO|nr:hypothetical protein DM02DRAFT_626820 [Periconia macrospinosa]